MLLKENFSSVPASLLLNWVSFFGVIVTRSHFCSYWLPLAYDPYWSVFTFTYLLPLFLFILNKKIFGALSCVFCVPPLRPFFWYCLEFHLWDIYGHTFSFLLSKLSAPCPFFRQHWSLTNYLVTHSPISLVVFPGCVSLTIGVVCSKVFSIWIFMGKIFFRLYRFKNIFKHCGFRILKIFLFSVPWLIKH